jgi:2-haloalkanoic acid dehalogenase type II
VGDWPAFPDTVAALHALQERYRLVILSNVDRLSFAATQQRLGVTFYAVHTAQDIGTYKPDVANFVYLIERLATDGIEKSEILHVAQSLYHDHAPANRIGLASAWIDRRHDAAGWGATAPPPQGVRYDFRFESLAELAAASA